MLDPDLEHSGEPRWNWSFQHGKEKNEGDEGSRRPQVTWPFELGLGTLHHSCARSPGVSIRMHKTSVADMDSSAMKFLLFLCL